MLQNIKYVHEYLPSFSLLYFEINELQSVIPGTYFFYQMHLSFLLDLSTDDCDCSFIYDTASQVNKEDRIG